MKPVLYTFRRCPYAIRARLAIEVSGVAVDTFEVDLRDKPQALMECSPKGTVPVLRFADGRVIDESLDIMRWALSIHDPGQWAPGSPGEDAAARALIEENDGPFKRALDLYKYANRHPGQPAEYYRDQAGPFLQRIGSCLDRHPYLMGDRLTLSDTAIVPFVRQFSLVDREWFYSAHAGATANWLDGILGSPLFIAVMKKEAPSHSGL